MTYGHTHDIHMTTGEGDVDIIVSLSYDIDECGTYHENIEKITCSGMDITGIFCDEQWQDLEIKAVKLLAEYYEKPMDYEP